LNWAFSFLSLRRCLRQAKWMHTHISRQQQQDETMMKVMKPMVALSEKNPEVK
jgi:hypothetical protein